MTDALHVLVDREDISVVRTEQTPTLEPGMGEVLVRVNRVALTANNVTYAVVADRIPYFEFFPAPPGWGRLPVWGFGDVEASNAPGLEPGERLYGFWPTSTHVVLRPDRLSARSFMDSATHRTDLPAIYNSYSRVATDETYQEHQESQIAVFRPLFLTAYTLNEFLASSEFDGIGQIVVSSASSKTAWALAHQLEHDRSKPAIGLTSQGHHEFVVSLGVWADVITYDNIDALPQVPTVYVDFSGNGMVRERVRSRLGPALKYDCAVGVAHHHEQAHAHRWDGPDPKLFFAPTHLMRLIEERGAAAFGAGYAGAWAAFLSRAEGHLRIVELNGIEALADAFRDFVAGDIDPRHGVVVRI